MEQVTRYRIDARGGATTTASHKVSVPRDLRALPSVPTGAEAPAGSTPRLSHGYTGVLVRDRLVNRAASQTPITARTS